MFCHVQNISYFCLKLKPKQIMTFNDDNVNDQEHIEFLKAFRSLHGYDFDELETAEVDKTIGCVGALYGDKKQVCKAYLLYNKIEKELSQRLSESVVFSMMEYVSEMKNEDVIEYYNDIIGFDSLKELDDFMNYE